MCTSSALWLTSSSRLLIAETIWSLLTILPARVTRNSSTSHSRAVSRSGLSASHARLASVSITSDP
jgi:hypothetical protein